MSPGSPSRRRILVVDDEEIWAEAVAARLRTRGHDVQVVTELGTALERVERVPWDAAIIDVRLAPGDGTLVARRFRELHGDHVLMVSANPLEQDAAGWERRWPFLAKPCDLDDVEAAVARLLFGNGKAP